MVGVINDMENRMTMDFKQAGDVIYLLGKSRSDINSSEYLHKLKGIEFSPAPHFDLEEEYEIQQLVKQLIKSKLLQSAHDISEGGLITALLESGFNRNLGFDVQQSATNVRRDAYWFGEAQSRIVLSCTIKNAEALLEKIKESNLPYEYLGIVTEGNIDMEGGYWGHIEDWKKLYDTAIERSLSGDGKLDAAALEGEMRGEAKTLKEEAREKGIQSKGEVKGV
jgi:phosphoribosylformylglycinamidine synthase